MFTAEALGCQSIGKCFIFRLVPLHNWHSNGSIPYLTRIRWVYRYYNNTWIKYDKFINQWKRRKSHINILNFTKLKRMKRNISWHFLHHIWNGFGLFALYWFEQPLLTDSLSETVLGLLKKNSNDLLIISTKNVCVFVRQKSQFLYSQFLLFILIWNISSLIKMIFLVIVNWCLRKLNFMGEWYVNETANVLLLPQPTSYTMGRPEVCTQELTKGECTLYIQHNSTTFRTHRLSWCIVMMEGWSRT